MTAKRDHGGSVDAAAARWGGKRSEWLDLSTGINPEPYPVGKIPDAVWRDLPDTGAFESLETAARKFWNVPDGAAVLAANGASAVIARMPDIATRTAYIPEPTYNEHGAAFRQAGGTHTPDDTLADTHIYVQPNNPDGRVYGPDVFADRALTVIDESFCDVMPDASLIAHSADKGVCILKSFGKFWGLAGLRLGFVIGDPALIEPMRERLGPWSVSGPALTVGTRALNDPDWATATRMRLEQDCARLDALMTKANAQIVGGTSLFRLYDVGDAAKWQDRLAERHIWSRIFPYSDRWLRLGLPAPDRWAQLEDAL